MEIPPALYVTFDEYLYWKQNIRKCSFELVVNRSRTEMKFFRDLDIFSPGGAQVHEGRMVAESGLITVHAAAIP
jgi:hypothetical protein